MKITLGPRQAITNAPVDYDYGWMKTVIDNLFTDENGKVCRLVENDDDWHFEQQLMRYGSGLNLTIDRQTDLDTYLERGWLTPTGNLVPIHRIKVDMHQALAWPHEERREFLMEALRTWRHDITHNIPNTFDVIYETGHDMTYYFTCRGNEAAEQVKAKLKEFELEFTTWGPVTPTL